MTKPGTYSFYCDKQLLFFPNHREEGMEGDYCGSLMKSSMDAHRSDRGPPGKNS